LTRGWARANPLSATGGYREDTGTMTFPEGADMGFVTTGLGGGTERAPATP